MNIIDKFNSLNPFEPPKHHSAYNNISDTLVRTAAHAAGEAVIDGLSYALPNPYLVKQELRSNPPSAIVEPKREPVSSTPPSPTSRTAHKPEKPDTPDIRTMTWDRSDPMKFDYLPHPDKTKKNHQQN